MGFATKDITRSAKKMSCVPILEATTCTYIVTGCVQYSCENECDQDGN